MNKVIYNASIIRFRPYRELGEFVNIGVMICFPQLGVTRIKVEQQHITRITSFFPEITKDFLHNSLHTIQEELNTLFGFSEKSLLYQNSVLPFEADNCIQKFQNLLSYKEGIFIFGDPVSGLTETPEEKLDALFAQYVLHNSPENLPRQERILEQDFRSTLKKWKYAASFPRGRIGNDDYSVSVPFFNKNLSIKTLCLDQSVMDIYEKGDRWISHVRRLTTVGGFGSQLLFSVKYPTNPKDRGAADEIVEELSGKDVVKVCPVDDSETILWHIKRAVPI